MGKKSTNQELAEHYNETGDLSGFDETKAEPVAVRRAVTISVRFSDEEIAQLRERADQAGVKVTSFIRAAALEAASPVDLTVLSRLARDLEQRAHDVATMAARGVA
ncbi:plasmid mobilization protein [Aeromicrobium sp. UBA7512]|nr:hypothetical protein [Aeromicrobium sp. UBA7512]